MKKYTVLILKKAERERCTLPPKDQQRVLRAIASLQTDPFRGKQLQGSFAGAFAIRVWPYRIIYTIEKEIVIVTVLRIGHRKEVYR